MRVWVTILLSLWFLAGCEQQSKFSTMSDKELRQQRMQCKSIKKKSPGKAIACENVEKEYQRRLKERTRG